jgi:hypothetical protein
MVPVPDMFFRPEEIHSTSGIRPLLSPFRVGNGHIPCYSLWFYVKDNPIANLQMDWQPAVQTRRVYLDRFTWKEPANCQRLKASLAEPLLLAVDGNTVLGW